jgi:hypothetical protein
MEICHFKGLADIHHILERGKVKTVGIADVKADVKKVYLIDLL